MKKFTFLIITFFIVFNVKAQKTEISLNLEIGKTYNQKMLSNIDIKQNMLNQDIISKLNVGGEISYTVKSKINDVYEFEVIYKSLNMRMEVADNKFDFASEKNDPNDVFSKLLAGIKNEPFIVDMTNKGEVVNVKNLDQLVNGLFSEIPNIPEEQKEAMLMQFNRSYGPESFKGNLEGVSLIYPQNPVKIGEQWITTTKLPSTEYAAQITTTYELLEKNKEYLLIKGIGKIETSNKTDEMKVKEMFDKFEMNGTFTSNIKIDAKTGWILEAKTVQNIIGDIAMKKTEAMPDGMKMSMAMINEMLITDK